MAQRELQGPLFFLGMEQRGAGFPRGRQSLRGENCGGRGARGGMLYSSSWVSEEEEGQQRQQVLWESRCQRSCLSLVLAGTVRQTALKAPLRGVSLPAVTGPLCSVAVPQ